MTPTETVSRSRRTADDSHKEEKKVTEQFGSEIIPHSMRTRRIKDAQAIVAAVEMIERMRDIEVALREIVWSNDSAWQADRARSVMGE